MLDFLYYLIRGLILGVFVILLPFIGGYLAGVWGFLFGLLISGGIAYSGPDTKISKAREAHFPKTSICLKCGSTARFTADDGRYAGFQCEKCKRFWKVKIKYY
jgi:hypothetical protein